MSLLEFFGRHLRTVLDRRAARSCQRFRAVPSDGFLPQVKPVGTPRRGRDLLAGRFMFGGDRLDAPGESPWEIEAPSSGFAEALHGFGWLDDLAAEGSIAARSLAQAWTESWVARFGSGDGPGWSAELAGRRLVNWLNHRAFLSSGGSVSAHLAMEESVTRQTRFLLARALTARSGVPSLEALTGLAYGVASLRMRPTVVAQVAGRISGWVDLNINAEGAIASRDPEMLANVLFLLTWAGDAIRAAGREPERRHANAIHLLAGAIRQLRLGDGSLARFQGGGGGRVAVLDHTLLGIERRPPANPGGAMGYSRMTNGASVVIVDTGALPGGFPDAAAHASMLAFEFSSGRFPLFVNTGPATHLGGYWREFCVSPAAHNTLSIERLGAGARDSLPAMPSRSARVTSDSGQNQLGRAIVASHDGYVSGYGLVHSRRIELVNNGTAVIGEDRLHPGDEDVGGRRRQEPEAPANSIGFSVGFCAHANAKIQFDSSGDRIHLLLPNGETWKFSQSGGAVHVRDARIVDRDHLEPQATQRIVVTSRTLGYEALVRWSVVRVGQSRLLV